LGWTKTARDEVFAPIRTRITEIWHDLNPDRDLDVDNVALAGGVRQQQKVTLELVAGGTHIPAALDQAAILSTGQRNALSLATYLPRATQHGSPFAFLMLDDPINAFDS
jgi:N-acetylglucosamine-6-phosphate deacetylase